jgi:hypothetical protein
MFMNVYLDNKIVVAIENGEYTPDKIRSLVPDKTMTFFYSLAHIREAHITAESYEHEEKKNFLAKRFNTIREVFDNNYLYVTPGDKIIRNRKDDPLNLYHTIELMPSLYNPENMILNVHSATHIREIRQQLGIDTKMLNKYSPKEVLRHFTTKVELNFGLKKWAPDIHEYALIERIELCNKQMGGGRTSPWHYRVAATYNLLDKMRYWRIEQPGRSSSEYADVWDIDHIFYASVCDYFICDDKKTRYKAMLTYDLYSIETKVISPKGE